MSSEAARALVEVAAEHRAGSVLAETAFGGGDVRQAALGLDEVLNALVDYRSAVVARAVELIGVDVDRLGEQGHIAVELHEVEIAVGAEELGLGHWHADGSLVAEIGGVLEQEIAVVDILVVSGVVCVGNGHGVGALAPCVHRLGCQKVGAVVAVDSFGTVVEPAAVVLEETVVLVGEELEVLSLVPYHVVGHFSLGLEIHARGEHEAHGGEQTACGDILF